MRAALREQSQWSPAFLEAIERLKPIDGVDELEKAIRTARTRKRAPAL